MLKNKKEWWQTLFDQYYLITDARSLFNKKANQEEIRAIHHHLSNLKINKNSSILDLCGGFGRHSLQLSKKGYSNILVADYSDFLIEYGKNLASKNNLNLQFVQLDARVASKKLQPKRFDLIMVLGNSFGYFNKPQDNSRVLKEIKNLLTDQGILLIDISNKLYFDNQPKFKKDWYEIDNDYVVCRTKEIKRGSDTTLVVSREMLIKKSKGLIRDEYYSETLFSKEWFKQNLKKAGLTLNEWTINWTSYNTTPLKNNDMGFLNSRILVIASKK